MSKTWNLIILASSVLLGFRIWHDWFTGLPAGGDVVFFAVLWMVRSAVDASLDLARDCTEAFRRRTTHH